MIKISTGELKEFFKLSSKVAPNTIIPILSYIKIECAGDKAIVTKTNLNTYCIHELNVDCEASNTILLDEKLLSIIVKGAASEEISINIIDKSTIISDGKTVLSFPTEDPINFPVSPEQGAAETTLLTADIIDSIGLSRHYMDELEGPKAFCFIVQDGNKSVVFATDTAIFYLKTFDISLPTLCLTKEACSIICMFEEVQHYTAGNYDFFSCGRTVYGFIKTTYKALPYKIVMGRVSSKEYFTASKADITNFCDTATSAALGQVPFASLKDDGEYISLTSSDTGFSIDVQTSLRVKEKSYSPSEFSFNSKLFSKAIKHLPYDELTFSPVDDDKGQAYFIKTSSDENFIGLVMGFGK